MDVIGWDVPTGSSGPVKCKVFRQELQLDTPQPLLLIEFFTETISI